MEKKVAIYLHDDMDGIFTAIEVKNITKCRVYY
jgi:hypothetical protein